jgi:hydrogenase maturation protease
MAAKHILVLGIGNTLFSDEGFGVHVVEKLQERYDFADNVSVVDGGVLGLGLMGIISQADHLIVVDAVRNKGMPGDFHRIDGPAIPERIRAKNSLHQVDFIEALSVCRVLDKVPETVIFGVEPEDIDTLSLELTPTIQARVDGMIDMVLVELDRLGASYRKRSV